MWRPPERIKWSPDPGRWPGRGEADAAALFQPIDIGPLTLESRTWVPAMVPWRAAGDGVVTPEVLGWYERFARGRPGAIVVEATGIRDIPSGPLLRIGDDRFIPGLKTLVETVARASGGHTRLLIQIIDFLAIRSDPAATAISASSANYRRSPRASRCRGLAGREGSRPLDELDDAAWHRSSRRAVRSAAVGYEG